MDNKLEIDGKEYIFYANRKAICALADIQDSENKEDLLDELFYYLLKKEHDLTREEVSDLLDKAEEEYKVSDLLEFATEILNSTFTEANKKKEIPLLVRKHKI